MLVQVGDFPCQTQQSRRLRLQGHTTSGPNDAPAATGTIKNASTSAIWILSGSIHQGEASESVKKVAKYSRKAAEIRMDNQDRSSKDIEFSLSVNFYLTASAVPCLTTAAAAGQLTAANASTRPTGPALGFAVKGEHHVRRPSTCSIASEQILGLPSCVTRLNRELMQRLASVRRQR